MARYKINATPDLTIEVNGCNLYIQSELSQIFDLMVDIDTELDDLIIALQKVQREENKKGGE